jgi:hypothetical protein
MIRKLMKRAEPGQIITLLVLVGFLIFFLKDAGITNILIVIALAVSMGLVLIRWSEVEEFDKEDIIDWKLITGLSNKDD